MISNMKPKVYLETSVISYLAARPSRDLIQAARQQITREWWDRREPYECFASQLVLREGKAGDPGAAAGRLRGLEGLPLLELNESIEKLARLILDRVSLPESAYADAVHIAAAATYGMDYLLTWNCSHLANATLRKRIESTCREAGFEPPTICTPEEFPGG